MDVLSPEVRRFVRATGPQEDAIQREMAEHAAEHGFPVIGPEAGGVLCLLARLTDARRVFEFGSGFGYSASWFARGMGSGDLVLTEHDVDELDLAREFFDRASYDVAPTFESGDALDIVNDYDGPFDLVLMDHQKYRYADALEAVREKLAPGAVVLADNIMRGPIEFDALLEYFEDGSLPKTDEDTRGIAEYLATVRDAPDIETVVLPVGNGLAVSYIE